MIELYERTVKAEIKKCLRSIIAASLLSISAGVICRNSAYSDWNAIPGITAELMNSSFSDQAESQKDPVFSQPEEKFFTVTEPDTVLYRLREKTGELRGYKILPIGTMLRGVENTGEFLICGYEDYEGQFCVSLNNVAEGLYYVLPENGLDLRFLLPDAEYDILFATERNITGHAMYPAIPMLERKTAYMLQQANAAFKEDGFAVKLYDTYRPKSAQFELYDIVQDSRFIANPYENNSFHQVGRAVDMSLIELKTGKELEMPTPMHTFNVSASRFNSDTWTETARKNVEYMTNIMIECGFRTISTEWWHFENGEEGDYMDPYLDYSSLPLLPADEYGDCIFPN